MKALKNITKQIPTFAGEFVGVMGASMIDAKLKDKMPEQLANPAIRGAVYVLGGSVLGSSGKGKAAGLMTGLGSGMRAYGYLLLAQKLMPDMTTVRIEGVGAGQDDLYSPYGNIIASPAETRLFAEEQPIQLPEAEVSGMYDSPYDTGNSMVSGIELESDITS